MKKLFLLLLLITLSAVATTKPTGLGKPQRPYQVKIVDDGIGTKDWVGFGLTFAAIVVSAFALYQLSLAKKALVQSVDNRNLEYLSEIDRMLIEKPELWRFYDAYQHKGKKVSKGALRGFIYFKLNHFEITLNEEHLRDTTRRSWQNYMIYCLQHSTPFRKEAESILLDKGYKGIFGLRFITNLAELYKAASDENSPQNQKFNARDAFSATVRQQLNRISPTTPAPEFLISQTQIDALIDFYKKEKENDLKP